MHEVKGIGKLAIICVSKTSRAMLWEIKEKEFKKTMREVADAAIEEYYAKRKNVTTNKKTN
jgi:hypothetical protein